MARRQSLPPRPTPSPDRLLRFSDGITVDPILCPQRIHARSHWIDGQTCRCAASPDTGKR